MQLQSIKLQMGKGVCDKIIARALILDALNRQAVEVRRVSHEREKEHATARALAIVRSKQELLSLM